MSPGLFVSHDGAIDELVALALLASAPEIRLRGVSLIHADCLAEPAWSAQAKILRLLGRDAGPCSLSDARPWNQFPWEYRRDSLLLEAIEALEGLAAPPPPDRPDGEERLRQALAEEPATVLALGPLTPVKLALERAPELHRRIQRIVWCGGALDVPGNLDPQTLPGLPPNRRAEWNAHADPFALDWLLRQTAIPLTIVPLDLTDRVPLDSGFLAELARLTTPAGRFAAHAYALIREQPLYRLWDVTAAAAVLAPELFAQPRRIPLQVELWGAEQGSLRSAPGAREADVILDFADGTDRLYEWVLTWLSEAPD